MRINKRKLKELAKQIAKTNAAIYNAIGMAGSLNNNNVVQEICNKDIYEENIETHKELAKIYKKLNKDNNEFADPELYGSEFQDFCCFVRNFEEYIEEIEV